jgi:TonB family protein
MLDWRNVLIAFLSVAIVTGTAAQQPAAEQGSTPPAAQAPLTLADIRAHGTLPRIVSSVDPDYTREARKAKISGTVTVSLVVDEHGTPTDLKVVRGLGYGLDEEALKAVSRYRFEPATYERHPIRVPLTISVSFDSW